VAETLSARRPFILIWRALILVGCGGLAWFAFASAVAHIVRGSNPEAALQFAPGDPVALSGKAEAALGEAAPAALVSPQTKALVLASLRAQAVNPRALRQLGFVADVKGDIPSAQTLITLSEKSSRREFGAQLWLIENGIRRDDMRATLVHYDTALRSGYDSGAILYPILTSALDDREVQAGFARYIKNPPPWLGLFLTYAISQGVNPASIATTIMGAGQLPEGAVYRDFERQLLAQLAAKKLYAEARQYYLSLADIDRNLPISIGFGKTATNPQFAPISWEVQNTPGVGAAFEGGDDGKAQRLNLFAGSGEQGIVLRKLLFLPAGRYAISQDIKLQKLESGATAAWEVRCLGFDGETALWRGDFIPRLGSQTLPVFDISAGCNAQAITLIIAGGSSQNGSEVVLANAALRQIAR
jgi:hypothetical protein